MKRRISLLLMLLSAYLHLLAATVGSKIYGSDELSSTRFNCITQDRYGYIWVATEYGLNKFDGYRFTSYLHSDDNPRSLPHNFVVWLTNDSQGRLWVLTARGLACYDYSRDDFQPVTLESGNPDHQPRISRLVEDADGTIYVGTSGFGLYTIRSGETRGQRTHQFSAGGTNDYFQNLFVDNQNRLWIQDNNSCIACYDLKQKEKPRLVTKYTSPVGYPQTFMQGRGTGRNVLVVCDKGVLSFDDGQWQVITSPDTRLTVECSIRRRNGDIWFGTRGEGIYYSQQRTLTAAPVDISNNSIDMQTAQVFAIFEDRQGNLWAGCNEKGLLFVSAAHPQFSQWSLSDQGIKTGSAVSSVCSDGNGGVWCSVRNGRLYHFDSTGRIIESREAPANLNCIYRDGEGHYWLGTKNQVYRFQPSSGQYTPFKTLDCDNITSLADDNKGTLFVSAEGRGMCVLNSKTGQTRQYDMYQTDDPRGYLCNNWVQQFLYDRHGLLWVATSYGVACYDPQRDHFNTYGWHNLLSIATPALAETVDDNIAIGTDDGLYLFHRKKNQVDRFPHSEPLQGAMVKSIVCLPDGDLWCSTSQGLWHYQSTDSLFVCHVNTEGLVSREYSARVRYLLPDGRLLFGNGDGFATFRPQDVEQEVMSPDSIRLTAMLVGDRQEDVLSHRFSMAYQDNTFTMEFSNFDFMATGNTTLEYRIGNDPWQQTAIGQNAITFNHLQPGTYRLEVRAVNRGLHSATEQYTITIRAPWYRTWIAYTVYALLFLLLLGFGAYLYWRRRKERLDEEKMQFLINATHDIRTPLTLILSPLHKLMKSQHEPTEQESLNTIEHNARRILNLVNQILDIRKIDKQQMRLQCEETALVPFINNIYKVFQPYAKDHNINFRFDHPHDVTVWIDRVQFDKVVQNLLSNAFKFTPDGGEIVIQLLDILNQTRLTVTDSGTGLREADIPKLFTRFYQSVSNQMAGKEGTGIGLNLCKMIVEMHHGTITAENRKDGIQGSQFTVTLANGNEHLKPEEVVMRGAETLEAPVKKTPSGKRYRILLVDDDAEITDYITTELSDHYRFGICQNGQEAMTELLSASDKYDLVVSDIMMPEIDGFTLLRMVKTNAQTSHVPVILLTSESAVGNRLEGLERGADAFLSKPFLIDELQAHIDSILANIQRLRGKYSGAVSQEGIVEQQDVADNDKQLMERIMKSVNKNISDSDYSVEQMASDVGLSRVQLYRRVKELTGLTPTEFVRNLRLEQAARLLKERKVGVSQVAYTLGYSNLSHFSRIFKQHFGVSPTEYAGS